MATLCQQAVTFDHRFDMAKQQVIRVSATKDQTVQCKAQKEFNRLTRRIEKTEKELSELRDGADKIQQRIDREYRPLVKKLADSQARLVKLFDRAYDHPDTTRSEKKKLAYLIRELAFDLIDQHGLDALKPVYDKYADQGYDNDHEQDEQTQLARLRQLASQVPGIDLSEVDRNDPIALEAFIQAKIREKKAADEQSRRQEAEREASRPKSARQQARDEKREEEARRVSKSVRTLYVDLVKAFHPDREPDEGEKARKTEIMQRVTQAYEVGDLMGLLRLQLEFDRLDQNHLEILPDEQLLYYNKILEDQAQDLDQQLFNLQSKLGQTSGAMFGFVHSAISLEFSYNTALSQLRKSIRQTKSDLELLVDIDLMKLWLREYTIPK